MSVTIRSRRCLRHGRPACFTTAEFDRQVHQVLEWAIAGDPRHASLVSSHHGASTKGAQLPLGRSARGRGCQAPSGLSQSPNRQLPSERVR